MLRVDDCLANGDVGDAGDAHDVARTGLLDFHAAQPVEREQLRDLRLLLRAIELHDDDRIVDPDAPVEDPANGNPPEVLVRVEVRDEQLEARVAAALRRRHMVDDGIEQRTQVDRLAAELGRRGPLPRVRVEDGKLDLLLGGIQIDEQVIDLVQHLGRTRIRAIDLVHDHQRHEPPLERLAEHEPRLWQRALRRVHQEDHPVDHGERPLHLTAEIRVARGVDDVDQQVLVVNRRVLRQDGDTALALEIGVVHHALDQALVDAENPALPEQGVDERGLAMVDVRDDGNVAAEGIGDALRGLHV